MVLSGLIPGSKKQKFPVSTSKAPYNIYAESMINCFRGLPLWKSTPPQLRHGVVLDHVSIAHVGYIHDGRFKLLFDAGQDLGLRQRGVDVPDDFFFNPRLAEERSHPVLEEPREAAVQFWGFEEQMGIKGSTSISGFSGVPGLPSASASLDLHTTREQGAVLKTHDQTHVLNASSLDVFKEYMQKNYRSWVRFGQDNYHSVDYDNLVIVTGVDLTSSCSMLVYAKNSTNMSASFSLDAAAFGSASLSAWKDRKQPELCWSSSGSDDYLAGLILPATSSGMTMIGSTSPLPRQCIFLRGWRSRSRRAPKRIQGSAGPDDVGSSPDSSEPDSLGESYEEARSEVSTDADVDIVPMVDYPVLVDPFQPLFDYVFERTAATVAFLHDAQYQTLSAARMILQSRKLDLLGEDMTILQVMDLARLEVEVDKDSGVGTLQLDLFTPVDVVLDMIAQERSSGMNEGQVSPNISSPPPQPSPSTRLEHAVPMASRGQLHSSRHGSPSAPSSLSPPALYAPLSPRRHNAKDATKAFSKDPSVPSATTVLSLTVQAPTGKISPAKRGRGRPKGSKNKKTLESEAAMRAAADARTPPPDDNAAGPSEPARPEILRAGGPPKRLAEDEEAELPSVGLPAPRQRQGRPRKRQKTSPSL